MCEGLKARANSMGCQPFRCSDDFTQGCALGWNNGGPSALMFATTMTQTRSVPRLEILSCLSVVGC
jgi:hypothetical protein